MARADDQDRPGEPEQRETERPAPPPEERAPATGADQPARSTPVTQQLGRIAVLVLLIVFVVFALDNAQHVDFSWLVGGTEVTRTAGERVDGGVRLIVLLLSAFAIGAAVGGTVVGLRARARRKAAADR